MNISAAGIVNQAKAAKKGDDKEKIAEKVVRALFAAGVMLWHDDDGNAFATLTRPNRDNKAQRHIEHHRVATRTFKNIVRLIYGAAISQKVMADIIGTLDAKSLEGPCQKPAVRVMRHGAAVVIDLGTPDWQMVAVTADGWRIIPSMADVPFIRPNGMRAMAIPVDGHPFQPLLRLVSLLNVQSNGEFMVCVAWLIAAPYPEGPYPILAVDGEAGTAKTTACTFLRDLVDPNKAPLRGVPRDETDIILAARNSRVLGYDNLSNISPEMADVLCRVATGAGFSTRQLYTNDEEFLVSVRRPVIFNGINSMLARGDLADRASKLTLAPIGEDQRRTERAIQAEFWAAAPGILGALLLGVSAAIRNLPTLKLSSLPRMADFAMVACAAAPAFGWTSEQMLDAIRKNKGTIIAAVAEGDTVAQAVMRFLEIDTADGEWEGNSTKLLEKITPRAPDAAKNRYWPKDGPRLSIRLRRVAPALRAVGVDIELPTSGSGDKGRLIKLKDRRERPSDDQEKANQQANSDSERPKGAELVDLMSYRGKAGQ